MKDLLKWEVRVRVIDILIVFLASALSGVVCAILGLSDWTAYAIAWVIAGTRLMYELVRDISRVGDDP